MDLTNMPDLIQWHEGMPLLPQHFQQMALRFENIITNYYSISSVYNYGILSLEIDKTQLVRNIFSIQQISAIMQDGLYVKSDNPNKEKLIYNLPDLKETHKLKLSLHLCIPKFIEKNYVVGHFPRYLTSEMNQIEDLNTLSDPINIPKLVPNIFLASEDDLEPNLNHIKICELSVENGSWHVRDYIPASVFINKGNKISKICLNISQRARIKANIISDILNNETKVSQITENYLFLMNLNSILPSFEALLDLEKIHPYQLYLALCQFIGVVGILDNSYIAKPPILYDHQNLLKMFEIISEDINTLLDKTVSDHYNSVLFEYIDNKFVLNIGSSKIMQNIVYVGIKGASNESEEDAIKWFENALICDDNNFDVLLKNRDLGFARRKTERHPKIVPGRNVIIFEVEIENYSSNSFKLCIFNGNKNKIRPEDLYYYQKK